VRCVPTRAPLLRDFGASFNQGCEPGQRLDVLARQKRLKNRVIQPPSGSRNWCFSHVHAGASAFSEQLDGDFGFTEGRPLAVTPAGGRE